jgi:cytochrome c oxidase subunit IV
MSSALFLSAAAFYLLVAGIYWFMSHDEVGAIALTLTSGLAAMVGFYLMVTANRMAVQPEDNAHGEIWDADPDFGHYSPHSWAPLMVGVAAAITFAGLAFAAWIFVAGAVLVIMTSAYWLFEYYSGPDAQF